eukprot:6181757-Pleurochrysis_carterae.AAC.2
MEMDCLWKPENKGVPKKAATGSGEEVFARQGQRMRCQAWRAKPPKTSRMTGVTTCPRRSASLYFACWSVGGKPMMEESRRGSVSSMAKATPRVGRGAQPVGMGLTILSSKSLWCRMAVYCARHRQDAQSRIQAVGEMSNGTMHGPDCSKPCMEGQGKSIAVVVAVHCYIPVRVTSTGAGQGAERLPQTGGGVR